MNGSTRNGTRNGSLRSLWRTRFFAKRINWHRSPENGTSSFHLAHRSRHAWYQKELVGWIGNFNIAAQLLIVEHVLNLIILSFLTSKKSLAEMKCKLFRIGLLKFSSWQLSEYTKLEVFLERLLHYIESDRIWILYQMQDWSLWLLSIRSISKKNTVCLLLELWPPGIIPELMIDCKLNAHPLW